MCGCHFSFSQVFTIDWDVWDHYTLAESIHLDQFQITIRQTFYSLLLYYSWYYSVFVSWTYKFFDVLSLFDDLPYCILYIKLQRTQYIPDHSICWRFELFIQDILYPIHTRVEKAVLSWGSMLFYYRKLSDSICGSNVGLLLTATDEPR